MGKRDRGRIERIRTGLEAPIACREGDIQDDWGEWEEIASFDERAPIWYMKQFLDGEGVPYQISDESCPELPDQYGEAIVFTPGTGDKAADLCRRATEKWLAEGRPK
ncbi:MAG TPA: hypothetical protein VFA32_05700 [Dehalococcoidia bacterium]|jgi:hypothetical protein|nr:hypothetical protein [Dehalococcoidia bacterium]